MGFIGGCHGLVILLDLERRFGDESISIGLTGTGRCNVAVDEKSKGPGRILDQKSVRTVVEPITPGMLQCLGADAEPLVRLLMLIHGEIQLAGLKGKQQIGRSLFAVDFEFEGLFIEHQRLFEFSLCRQEATQLS